MCLVVRFPDSTEILYRDEPPEPGSRMSSSSGQEWFVEGALQSGRNTYTVFCVGRDELLEGSTATGARARLLADDLVGLARRSMRGAANDDRDPETGERRGERHRFIVSVVDSDGRALEYVISARTSAEAEREAREGAREWHAALVDVRREEQPPSRPRSASARMQSLFRRRVTSS